MKKFDMVIYHGNCADGFTAAWVAWNAMQDESIEFVAGAYGKAPPDVTGKHVLMVDFSYKRQVLEALAITAKSITILDHHKSAAADLADFVSDERPNDLLLSPVDLARLHPSMPIQAEFDMERSGAMMTWDYFHPGEKAPTLVEYVQDRDLWRHQLKNSRAIHSWLMSYLFDFEIWDELNEQLVTVGGIGQAFTSGKSIDRAHLKTMNELLAVNTYEVVIRGHTVKVANMPYHMASDAAHALAHDRPFGATFYIRADGKYVWSLRSEDNGADVSKIAEEFGGGGHAQAAGFQTSIMFPRPYSPSELVGSADC